MKLRKSLCFSLSFVIFSAIFTASLHAQDRARIARSESRPINAPNYQTPAPTNQTAQIKRSVISLPTINSRRPMLTNNIEVVQTAQNYQPLVKKTGSSQPINAPSISQPLIANSTNYANRSLYSSAFSRKLLQAIQVRIGIPYRYGSEGPTSYDCSGLVWSVFEEAGYNFERTSARAIWQNSDPVEGDDRFKLGTLVFFNGLAHIGIVADAEGFYQASSSRGVTYTKFEGYWAKRIVGFRRMRIEAPTPVAPKVELAQMK